MAEKKSEIKYRFARELVEWVRTGRFPESANQDVCYALELQRTRLNEHGLCMDYELEPPKDGKEFITYSNYDRANRRSKKYECFIDRRSYYKTLSFYRNGKKIFSKRRAEVLFATNTWLKEGEITGEETYCCPACGAISTIRKLQDGCPYCNTHFRMSDLFPKVTGYFFVHEVMKSLNIKKSVSRVLIIAGIIGGVFHSLANFAKGPAAMFTGLIAGIAAGVVIGYIIWALSIVISMLGAGVVSMITSIEQNDTKRRIVSILNGFDPSFSYDYFVNQIVSNLKMILFSKSRNNLVMYEGMDPHPEFDNIVEATFNGKILLNHYNVQDGYCTLCLNIHMGDVYDNGGKLSLKKDVFCVTIVKNVMRQEDLGFSIKKVQCSCCGGSFDATKERHCPYCKAPYDMKQDGWVSVDIRKVK